MIVRTRNEIEPLVISTAAVKGAETRRFLLKKDGMGFTLTDTIMLEGESTLWYKNHLEAAYCIEGEAEIEVLEPEPKIYQIRPGTLYALDKHDKHIVRVRKKIRAICVFNPPLITGKEIHDADGALPPTD